MPYVKAYEEIANPRVRRDIPNGFIGHSSRFIQEPEDKSTDSPQCFLAEGAPNEGLRTHFHIVDQFQLVWNGDGTLGKHKLVPGAVHFARAYTPYGPIRNGATSGVGYLTMRARRDPGAQWIPEAREKLDKIENRKPWQVTVMPDLGLDLGGQDVVTKPMEGLTGQPGLAGWSIKMKPGAKFVAPDPSKGDGQYIVVMNGSIQHEGKDKKGLAIVWVGRNEKSFEIVAGASGMEGLIMNFPGPGDAAEPKPAVAAADLKTWMCVICGFMYEEADGIPEEGIAPGTRWADVPDDFGCPDCSATKADFEMVEI